jgi:general stress protein 26
MFSLFSESINDFIKKHATAVIATIDEDGQPSTSTIFYVINKKDEIHFVTKSQTTKSNNLNKDSRSAITVVDESKPMAVNMQGLATQVTDVAERDEVMQRILKISHDKLKDFAPIIKLHRGSFMVFKFTPKEASMTDFSKPMGSVKEVKKNY